jgi:hypothetical protein
MKSMGGSKITHPVSPGLCPGILMAGPGQSPGLRGNHNPGRHKIFMGFV